MNFEPNQGRHRDEGLGWKRLSDQRLATFAQSAATRNGRVAEFSPCPDSLPASAAGPFYPEEQA